MSSRLSLDGNSERKTEKWLFRLVAVFLLLVLTAGLWAQAGAFELVSTQYPMVEGYVYSWIGAFVFVCFGIVLILVALVGLWRLGVFGMKPPKGLFFKSKTDSDYIIGANCGLEQWRGYETCEKCGVVLKRTAS